MRSGGEGTGVGVVCLGGVLPFVGIVGEGDYGAALREYREGVGSRVGDFMGARFDPFDEARGALGGWTRPLGGVPMSGGARGGAN